MYIKSENTIIGGVHFVLKAQKRKIKEYFFDKYSILIISGLESYVLLYKIKV